MQIIKKTILFALCIFSTPSWAQNSNVTVGGCSIVAVNANIAGSIIHCNPPRGRSSSSYLRRCISLTTNSTVVGSRGTTEESERACLGVIQNFAETAELCEEEMKRRNVRREKVINSGENIKSEDRELSMLSVSIYFNCSNYLTSVKIFRSTLLDIYKNKCHIKRARTFEKESVLNCLRHEEMLRSSGLQLVTVEEHVKELSKKILRIQQNYK